MLHVAIPCNLSLHVIISRSPSTAGSEAGAEQQGFSRVFPIDRPPDTIAGPARAFESHPAPFRPKPLILSLTLAAFYGLIHFKDRLACSVFAGTRPTDARACKVEQGIKVSWEVRDRENVRTTPCDGSLPDDRRLFRCCVSPIGSRLEGLGDRCWRDESVRSR